LNFTEYLLTVNAQLLFLSIKSNSELSGHETKLECATEATEIYKELMQQIKDKEEFDQKQATLEGFDNKQHHAETDVNIFKPDQKPTLRKRLFKL